MKLKKNAIWSSRFLFLVVLSLMSGGALAAIVPLNNGNFASPDVAAGVASSIAPDGWETIAWTGGSGMWLQDNPIYPSADQQGIKVYSGAAVAHLGQTTAEVITAGKVYTGSFWHNNLYNGAGRATLYLMGDDGGGTVTPIVDTGPRSSGGVWAEGFVSFAADDYPAMIGQLLRVELKGEANGAYEFLDDVKLAVTTSGETARDLKSDTWVATDALGRELPDYEECGPQKTGKFVGIFYFLWLGQHGTGGPYDITKILAANPTNPNWGSESVFHHWGESELGYYLSSDPYVIRKHAYMLANAGVDTLIFDVTNAFTYRSNYLALCSVFNQIRAEGGDTPQICFLTHTDSVTTVQQLYNEFYAQNLYPELWFQWQGKPLILADLTGHSQTIQDFFTIKYSWAWDAGYNKWQWLDTYPQDYGWGTPGVPEEVPVTVASHPLGWDTQLRGRSYQNGSNPPLDIYKLTGTEDQGLCFAEQWQKLDLDPSFIFITGWNEWVAQRGIADSSMVNTFFLDKLLAIGDTYFVDLYNYEWNRDIEPMKDGSTDNYYYQMIAGIRRFKGVSAPETASPTKTIAIDGDFSDWMDVGPEFRDNIYDTTHRNEPGWGSAGTYINTTGRNDFVTLKVARDDTYVYFYAQANDNITNYTDSNWMMLFIDADQNNTTGWEGYDYAVNMAVNSSVSTTLKSFNGGWNWITANNDIAYRVVGQEMELKVPRVDIGQGSGNGTVAFDFHWADNIQQPDNIIEFSISGDSAPNRRFKYRYDTSYSAKACQQLWDAGTGNLVDLDNDCDIDLDDLRVLSGEWLVPYDFYTFSQLTQDWLSVYLPDNLLATTVLEDDFEGSLGNWITNWDLVTNNSFSPIYSIECSSTDDNLESKNLVTSNKSSIRITFKYKINGVDNDDDVFLQYYDGSNYDNIVELGINEQGVWLYYSDTIYNFGGDTQYFIDNFRMRITGTSIDAGEAFWVDDVRINVME